MRPEEIQRHIESSGRYGFELVNWRMQWLATARPKQLPPPGDWDYWATISGRGWGKTRVGAEETGYNAAAMPQTRWAVVGPTQNDVRSVCFEGESGLLNIIPSHFIKKNGFNRSLLELELKNGSIIAGRSAEKPDRLRGPQWHGAWCDELASWGATAAAKKKTENARLQDTWDNLIFGLRLGTHPRVVITTTPRPLQFLRDLVKDPRCRVSRGSTFENKKHLAGNALRAFKSVYSGTRRGEQELYAKILDDVQGALWSAAMLENLRVKALPPGVTLVRVVIAVDPAVTSEDNSDEWGLVAAGLGSDGHVYVMDDWSGIYSPADAAANGLLMYERYEADTIVAEVNQGGDLVEAVFRAEDPNGYFGFKKVRAKRGKYLRAEPVAAYYEKGMVHHVGVHTVLESQMRNFTGSTGDDSPDRLDALVYAILELMTGTFQHDFF